MAQQLSTSATDAMLLASILYFIFFSMRLSPFACIGLAVQGVAATLGIIRFAQVRQVGHVYDFHKLASWLAQVVGLPLLAVGFCYKYLPVMMAFNFLLSAVTLLLYNFVAPGLRNAATAACSGFALLTILMVCLNSWNPSGLYGVAMYVLSGIIGSEGSLFGIYRVDLLHIALVVGNILFTWAIRDL